MHSQYKYGNVYGERVGLLPQDCYKRIRLNNACSTKANHCWSFPACDDSECMVRKLVQPFFLTGYKTTSNSNTAPWHVS